MRPPHHSTGRSFVRGTSNSLENPDNSVEDTFIMVTSFDPKMAVEFGRFGIRPLRREFLADGQIIPLGARAFDILLALLEAHGNVVSKDALMQRVWPSQLVSENNLQAQIAALRKALGPDRDLVRTIARQGYQFVGTVTVTTDGLYSPSAQLPKAQIPSLARPLTNLPTPISALIGREAELQDILNLTDSYQLVTLTGPGGIGKTRLSLEVARDLAVNFQDGAWLIQLASLADPSLVPGSVATAVGLNLPTDGASPESIAAALQSKHILLLFDNCEHMVDAVTQTVEAVLHTNPAAQVIATSRQPLGADGERIYQVPSLTVPATSDSMDASALTYGACRLFVDRARAIDSSFSPSGPDIGAIVEICRHLDGMPLAIELAAARAATLGVNAIASRLGDHLQLLSDGRRTAMSRHQTLRATLDWSYELLSEAERVVLRRLAVFRNRFTISAAIAIANNDTIDNNKIIECVENLVVKSLIISEPLGRDPPLRLLETTKSYLLKNFTLPDECNSTRRRHACYFLDILRGAEVEAGILPLPDWSRKYRAYVEDIRAALYWAFSLQGDMDIAIRLTVYSIPLWLQLSLMEECHIHVERALAIIRSRKIVNLHDEMILCAALATSSTYSKGPTLETRTSWTRALELAEAFDDSRFQLAALWGLAIHYSASGEHHVEMTFAQRFCRLANQMDPVESRAGDHITGTAFHYMGDQASSRRYIERVLTYSPPPTERLRLYRFQFDQASAARCILSHVLWLQGAPKQAVRAARDSLDGARATGHAFSVCNALAQAACPIAVFVGDFEAAERFALQLVEQSHRNAMIVWRIWGQCWMATVAIKRGDLSDGVALLQTALEELKETRHILRLPAFLAVLAEGLGDSGRVAQGLITIANGIAQAERGAGYWYMPELRRVKGRLLQLADGSRSSTSAEEEFLEALDEARRQGALSWELRVSMHLAKLWREQARRDDARELLVSTFNQFNEGFETVDLKAARTLIDSFE